MFADWTKIPSRKDFTRGLLIKVYVDTDHDFLYRDKESGVLHWASVTAEGKIATNFETRTNHGHWFGCPSSEQIDGKCFEVVNSDITLTEAREYITMLSRKLTEETE